MSSFNVLDPELDLFRHYLLEASAGTGKTYSIENIILRLIVEGKEPLQLEQILAVTYTRAAAADMRARVRENLRRALEACRLFLKGETDQEVNPFIATQLHLGEQAVVSLKRRLEQALASFDRACIYTIHAFCARMLKEHMLEADHLISADAGQEDLSAEHLGKIVKDFFRTELKSDEVSPAQLALVLKLFKSDFDKLVHELAETIGSLMPIEAPPAYEVLFNEFVEEINALKIQKGICGDNLYTDFITLAPHYKSVGNKKEPVPPPVLATLKQFCALFDKERLDRQDFDFLIKEAGFWNDILRTKKVKFPALQLHYPSFGADYAQSVERVVKQAASPESIFAFLASRCQVFGLRILEENEKLGFNTLLRAMQKACGNASFVKKVRSKYQAVIVDEFQDTDPLQWEIFSKLFPPSDSSWGRLILVGDPKQSIYSFRQADIYTYLSASEAIGSSRKAYLDCNYRSSPSLVHALNALFDSAAVPRMIHLPRLNTSLEYLPVKAGAKTADLDFQDGRGSIHFHLIDTVDKYKIDEINEAFGCFIAQEIRRLHLEKGVKLGEFAILVADRFQARSLISILRRWNIPAVFQKAPTLAKSASARAMRELLTAVSNPRDLSALKLALGGPVIGWTHSGIRHLDQEDLLQHVMNCAYRLRSTLIDEGFPLFFSRLMETDWDRTGIAVEERLLRREDPLPFYNEWMQLADWLIEKHSHAKAMPEELIDDLLELEELEDDRADLKMQAAAEENAVQVLTIHSSKGLEFGIVFAAGLVRRGRKNPPPLIPVVTEDGSYVKKAVDKKDVHYLHYCEEADAEKMRQLYVAMTRAKHRLYVPAALDAGKKVEQGRASQIELFAARAGAPPLDYAELYRRVESNNTLQFVRQLDLYREKAEITYTLSSQTVSMLEALPGKDKPPIAPPTLFAIPGDPLYLKSYTLLAHSQSVSAEKSDGEHAPRDFSALEMNPHTLPSGSEAGILLHEILEKISFDKVRQARSPADLLDDVRPFLSCTPFKAWEEVIAQIIFSALKTPMLQGLAPLAEVGDAECYREMEFLFPADSEYGFDGYLKGVIDLVFRYEGKYYLVDWKSNWLGSSQKDYSKETMNLAMRANDYFLQAKIYKDALGRYLGLIDQGEFGGMAYVFLRGLPGGGGIYAVEEES